MAIAGLTFGLLDTSGDIGDPLVARWARELSIGWSRFKYFDDILEDTTVNGILDRALAGGWRYCLIQAHGHILSEIWHSKSAHSLDVMAALQNWIDEQDFFVTGHIVYAEQHGFGLDRRCLLVDLAHYHDLGRPAFGIPSQELSTLIRGNAHFNRAGTVDRLDSTEAVVTAVPRLPGWNFVQASLAAGIPVHGFAPAIDDAMLYLAPDNPARVRELRRCLGCGIATFDNQTGAELAGPKERRFFDNIRTLTQNLPRGVFVWNLESYADIEQPPDEFNSPLAALYTVAAGFKPNRILQTHGFDQRTRVVVFDYSPQGLEFRRLLHEEWHGEDYPGFLRYLFEKLPSGEAYYCLWDGATPERLSWDDVERRWQEELDAWGGARVLRDHWRRFRELAVEYVLCNLLTEPERLLERIRDERDAVIWWSNAFFSVYSNWFYTARERQDIYRRWIEAVSARAPRLFLYGSDSNNISVNFIQAEEYWRWYRRGASNELQPRKRHRHQLRF
ncbi:MAG: hypothetical protein WAN46_13320 [Gammaproteobacteria bacterium]|jgi:hypothetical protein